ncbi:MAG TPA: hypothetical protein VFP40_05085 [Terriglobales bacterium]|nr:hypothetical protein [Terriglobales bacterium]
MAKKKGKKKAFRAATAVKQAARNVIGSPKPTKREIPKTKQEHEKYKSTLRDLLSEDS